jgi:hypothetical protein
MRQEDFVMATVSLALIFRQVMSSEDVSKDTKEVIRQDLKRINARLRKAQQLIQSCKGKEVIYL